MINGTSCMWKLVPFPGKYANYTKDTVWKGYIAQYVASVSRIKPYLKFSKPAFR